MHYGAWAFSVNGRPTIYLRNNNRIVLSDSLGQRHGFSKVRACYTKYNFLIATLCVFNSFHLLDRHHEVEQTLQVQHVRTEFQSSIESTDLSLSLASENLCEENNLNIFISNGVFYIEFRRNNRIGRPFIKPRYKGVIP